MKNFQKSLVVLIVVLALVGFTILTVYTFYQTLITDGEVDLNNNFIGITNSLAGLIGGIVALGFGISPPADGAQGSNALSRSTAGLGQIVYSGNVAKASENLKSKQILGAIYALVYILLGVAAIIIWLADSMPHEIVSNLATVFLGMVLPIVAGHFRNNTV